MISFFLYPEGRQKAVTFSFDDGHKADIRLAELFNTYGLKGTWNLNSAYLGKEDLVTFDQLETVYRGQEVASHGATHGHMTFLPNEEVVEDIRNDRRALERVVKHPVTGFAYPNGYISDNLEMILKVVGIEYARTVRSTDKFLLPENFLLWDPTCHYRTAPALVEKFRNLAAWSKLPLFYIWGHSYELDRNNEWELMEQLCRDLSKVEDVWHATNIEICRYVKAVRNLVYGVDSTCIHNPSAIDVWVRDPEMRVYRIPAGETIRFAPEK